jgi:hypothetical protein
MTDYTLTDEQKKRLTEFLYGTTIIWEWNSWGYTGKGDMRLVSDFATPQDAHDLAKKLVEAAEWYEFAQYACMKFTEDDTRKPFVLDNLYLSAWLLTNPQRFAWLVSRFLNENKI